MLASHLPAGVLSVLLICPLSVVTVSRSLAQVAEGRCDPAVLGGAEMVDTATLTPRFQYDGLDPDSQRPMLMTGYYEGDSLKVLRVVIGGETGTWTGTYYFLSPQDYVIAAVTSHYAQPIGSDNTNVVSRSRQYYYVCNGEIVDTHYLRRARDLRGYLEDALMPLLRQKQERGAQ